MIYPVDLADAEAVAVVAKQITEELGTPDIIVNNAGPGNGFSSMKQRRPRPFR